MKAVRMAVPAAAALLGALLTIPSPAQSTQQPDSDQSWRTTLNMQDAAGNTNPTRVTESHQVKDGKTVDVQTLETKDINGGSQLYGQTETETVKVDATTTRTTTRHYVTGPDGNKVVNSVTVEEKRELPDGGETMVRTVSTPDPNGALQVTRREAQETSQTAPGVRTTNSTLFLPSPNGGLAPSVRSHEIEKQLQPGMTEYTKSVSLQDGSGNWQVNEVRQGTTEKSGNTETRQESVSRLNADGKMALAEKIVTKETSGGGEQHKQVQKFSTSMDGVTAYPDGKMHLDREVTTVTRTTPGGQQVTTETVNQRSQAAPEGELRPSQRTIDITSSGLEGVKQQTVTIESANPNGGMDKVWVDTKAGTVPVTVDTSKPAAPKPATPPQQ